MTLINVIEVPVRIVLEFKSDQHVPKFYEVMLIPQHEIFIYNRYKIRNIYIILSYEMLCVPYQIGQVFEIRNEHNIYRLMFNLVPLCIIYEGNTPHEQRTIIKLRKSLPIVYSSRTKIMCMSKTYLYSSYKHDTSIVDIVRDYKDLFKCNEV
jgi:hypothetical protein